MLISTLLRRLFSFRLRQSHEGECDGIFVDCFVEDDAIHRPAEVDVNLLLQYLNEVVQPENNKLDASLKPATNRPQPTLTIDIEGRHTKLSAVVF